MTASVACIIPAYNAQEMVAQVVAELRASVSGMSIIGIDDGSSDDTRAILDATCDETIAFDRNRGKGAALCAGLARALERGSDVMLTIDADGQHDPACVPRLIDALAQADLVVGTRERNGTMPLRRRITNALSAAAMSHLGGCAIPDAQSGFRAMRATVARTVRARGDRYEYETDFLIRAARAGFRIASVTVPTRYGPPSHFREVRDGMRVIGTFCRHSLAGSVQ